jgi:hypothetical protein
LTSARPCLTRSSATQILNASFDRRFCAPMHSAVRV